MAGAGLKVACAIVSSPAASPFAIAGVGLAFGDAVGDGDGDGEGDGLPDGDGVGLGEITGIMLAPVNKDVVAVDSVVIAGDRW